MGIETFPSQGDNFFMSSNHFFFLEYNEKFIQPSPKLAFRLWFLNESFQVVISDLCLQRTKTD